MNKSPYTNRLCCLLLFLLIPYSSIAQSINDLEHRDYVLENLDKYQDLGDFLINNADTLVLHNRTRSLIDIREERKKEYCSHWSPAYMDENSNRVPTFLQENFIEKIRAIDVKHLSNVNICLDKSVSFFVASDHEVTGGGYDFFFMIHILEYRSDDINVPYKYPTLRDSIVHPNFNYGIAIVED